MFRVVVTNTTRNRTISEVTNTASAAMDTYFTALKSDIFDDIHIVNESTGEVLAYYTETNKNGGCLQTQYVSDELETILNNEGVSL